MKKKIFLVLVFAIVIVAYAKPSNQDTIKSKVFFGIRINPFYDFEVKRSYNFRIIHLTPLFSIIFKNHNFYLGPQYSYVFQPKPISGQIFEHNSLGFTFGYRYYSNNIFKNTKVFGQFNYSVYQIEYENYQLGPPFKIDKKEIIAENTASLGIDFRVIRNLHFFIGAGFGSYDGFFLMINKFTLTSFLGIEYEFIKRPNR